MRATVGTAILLAGVLLLVSLTAPPAPAAGRVALVVGNGAYEHTVPLRNPANDAADMAAALRGLGFSVIKGVDLDRGAFEGKLREFARAARGADAALFFYAGHGIQVEGENYLLPVDARLSEELDLDFEALELGAFLRQMRSRANLVFLDACRDNPLAQDLARSMGASRSAAIGRGLGRVDASSGTLIAYATQPGNTAADGTGRNSPFTTALLEHIAAPGRSVNDLLTAVTDEVATATAGRQQPWTHSSLRKPFYFKQPETKKALPSGPAVASATPAKPSGDAGRPSDRLSAEQLAAKRLAAEEELLFWETVKDSAHAGSIRAYLDRYPEGAYAVLARHLLEQLKGSAGGEAVQQDTSQDGQPEQLAAISANDTPDHEAVEASLGLERGNRRAIQAGLASLGFDPGPADGLFGRKTRAALSAWQAAKGVAATGWLTAVEAAALKATGDEARRATAKALRKAEAERQARARAETRPGKVFRDCEDCPEMVVVPAGSFLMGPTQQDIKQHDYLPPARPTKIAKAFAVGKYEVTREEFARFVAETSHSAGNSCSTYEREHWADRPRRGWRNPGFAQEAREPVVCVNWHDARSYVRWLSSKTKHNYRLLTEEEWEYAARGGTATARYWGDDLSAICDHANVYDLDSFEAGAAQWLRPGAANCRDGNAHTALVGSYTGNGFGLHDVVGNVSEWVSHRDSLPRGGSWQSDTLDTGYFYPIDVPNPEIRISTRGFRIARTLAQ